jgi:hypothetical protein
MTENNGQDSEFDFSQQAIKNINRLLKLFKMQLSSSGKQKTNDKDGNVVWVDSNIYSTDQLVRFLVLSLSDFNQVHPFTYFTFDDTRCIEFFTEVLVSGATLYALCSQALIEKGKEFQITDDGVIVFDLPDISEMLNTQYSSLLEIHSEKVKMIKNYITYWNPNET